MSLVGRTIGRYRITHQLGEGGMGVVYRAEDSTLGRDVAIKVLRPELGRQPERMRRFSQEARAASALNHPNIVTVHDAGEFEDGPFLVMELVEGESLRAILRRGSLPLPKVLDIGIQATTALTRAHEGGITHRDLKPENLLVRPDGYVKILDFGLAKLKEKETAAEGASAATTVDAGLTSEGSILGTAAYMSPEQATGRQADGRSDIFSLALVLLESWQGRHPFLRVNTLDTLHAIAHDRLPALTYPAGSMEWGLGRVLEKALEKEPDERYQTMKDLGIDLRRLRQESESGKLASVAAVAPAGATWRPLRYALAGLVLLALLAGAALTLWRARRAASVRSVPPRAEFSQLTSQPGVEWFPSLSPDGKWLVYAGARTGSRHIYLQSASGQNPLDLSGDSTADDDQPAFSPDGERIAFRSSREGGGLFVMGRTGEAVRRVTRMGFKPSWSPDGTQLAFTTENVELYPQNSQGRSELWTVNVNTAETRRLSDGDAVLASWSPHNHRIALTQRLGNPGQRGGVWTIPVAGGTPMRVTSDQQRDWNPVWSPDGKYLYFGSDRGGSMNLWRVPIDEASGKTLGEPEPITTPAPYLAHPSLSADGKRIAFTSALVTANIQRATLDPATGAVRGEPEWVTTGSRRWSSPDPSSDGAWVAFYSLTQPEGQLYVARPDGAGLRQLTGDAARDRVPRWSPDGNWIACFSDRSGRLELWKIRPDGSDLQQLTEGGGSYLAWSPDGSRMASVHAIEGPPVGAGVWIFDPNRPWKQQTPEALPPLNYSNATPRFLVNSWSPDGARLAGAIGKVVGQAIAGEVGQGIAAYSLRSRTYEVLADFGEWPVWLPDNRRVLFVANGNAFFIVDTRSKQVRKVFSVARDVIGPPRLTRDGKTAYFSRRVTESDVWLLTLK